MHIILYRIRSVHLCSMAFGSDGNGGSYGGTTAKRYKYSSGNESMSLLSATDDSESGEFLRHVSVVEGSGVADDLLKRDQ